MEPKLAEEEIRLAWRAHVEGRIGTRDTLLTLAVADAGPEEVAWSEPCRRWLIARRPDHLFAPFPSRDRALADRRVVKRLDRARLTFPPARVRHLVLRSEALHGPYRGPRKPAELLAIIMGRPVPEDRGPMGPKTGTSRPKAAARRGEAVAVRRALLLGMAVLIALALQDMDADDSRAA